MPRSAQAAAIVFAALALVAPLAAPAATEGAGSTIALPVLPASPAQAGVVDDSWKGAAQVSLANDFTYHRPADEKTDVYLAQDDSSLDVAFVVHQRENVLAAQETNSSAVLNDDYVIAYFWPQGTHGFQYSFSANPHGARFQTSSENSAYSPQWTAVGKRTADGYSVTMRIALNVIRSGGETNWRVQLGREIVATNSLAVWTYSTVQQNANDPAFAGTLTGVGALRAAANRPKPRAQIYGLGEVTPRSNGGSTSRVGADLAIPVTPTASLLAAFHPDYSNVEIDQQTIAPAAFQYQYQEVRPFFTQAAQGFNFSISCSDCPQMLYTPSIPTFRQGYALEGTQGPVQFAAFDAVGDGRIDQAQALDYNVETTSKIYGVNVQHVSVDTTGGLQDDVTSFTSGFGNQLSHLFVYANGAVERGSLVTNPGAATYLETGFGFVNSTTVGVLNYQTIGSQFAPADGYTAQSGITGYEAFAKHTFNFSTTAPLHDIYTQIFYAWYHDPTGGPGQVDANETVQFDLRNLVSLKLSPSYAAARTSTDEFLPFAGNTYELGYKLSTNTPSYVQYAGGPFYHGKLDAWNYVTTQPIGHKLRLRLEVDEDNYLTHAPGEIGGPLWLDRATLDWQLSRDASFDLGARKIVGLSLPNAYSTPNFARLNATNITAAFHLLAAKNEFYFVYGDPNSLATTPALYLKWIRYIGAQKGT